MSNLLTSVNAHRCHGYQAASTTNITSSSEVDMKGYDSCLFILTLGTMVNLSKLTFRIKHGDTSGSLANSDAVVEVTSDGTDNTQVMIEVVKPQKRYLEPILTIADQDAVVDSIVAIQYNARDRATSLDSKVIGNSVFLSPADAT